MKKKTAALAVIAVSCMGVSMGAEASCLSLLGGLIGDCASQGYARSVAQEDANTAQGNAEKIAQVDANVAQASAIDESYTYTNAKSQQTFEDAVGASAAYTNAKSQQTLQESEGYTNAVGNAVNNDAKGYASDAQNKAEAYANQGDAATLKSADQYTNEVSNSVLDTSVAYADAVGNKVNNDAKGYANTAQSNAETKAQSDVNTLASSDARSFTTKHLQVNGNESVTGSSTVDGNETVGGTLTANGANMDNNVIQNVAAGTAGTDAANVNQVQQGDAATLQSANNYTNTQIAGANNFAQGAANQAQDNADQYAASGIAAALAMPSSPYLRPGHYAVGIQAATYGGEQGFGARATYQINNHWSANAGLSGGSGEYGQVGATVGVQYEG